MKYKTCFFSLVLGAASMIFVQLSLSILSVRYHWQHTNSTIKTYATTRRTANQNVTMQPTTVKSGALSGNLSALFSKWRLKKSTDLLLTIGNIGRMGNWMFQYASLLGIAAKNDRRPFVPLSNPLLKHFKLSFVESHNKKPNWVTLSEQCYACYDSKMEKLPKKNISLSKYLQSWRYFEDIRELVRREFTFKPSIDRAAMEKFKQLFQNKTKPVIAVHVRRTDMTTPTETRMGYVTAPLSYVQNAMTYMRRRYGNVTFLLASDDVKWCREKFAKSHDVIVIDKGDAAVDMATMSLCDHMIMTVGTYSWWTAWLINGHTVYFKDYPNPGKTISRGFKKEDHFLPGWVPLGS
ncbi:galactoside alpha-(1,2)-fucosyltransferase 2-like [Gigantopelta aegis]|uniref:galactoside alpha-(1,2)-fucosyltransferase 2-like n=1 Tax=Gigantopelta aegis TaxID=1735272 RepID=UPI001B88935C|nr:galactoside alpha-(1,2)-fucosyltransferase 2-like [Gigantopelta aegis]XP_041355996.1 galactoside alpha-(1,2)-fucosyltransferase 2-like [Gigantopelta aegis]